MRLPTSTTKFILLGILFLLVAACTGIEGTASMQVWLDYPYQELTLNEGSSRTLMATARDVNGPGIIGIQFFSNGQMIASAVTSSTDPLVSANYLWQPEPGKYEVFARAMSTSGAIAESGHITVTIQGQQFKGFSPPDEKTSATATITGTSVTPTITTTPRIPTVTPSPTRTNDPTRTLTQRPPYVNLTASSTSISPGDPVTLTWESVNTNSLTLNGSAVSNYSGSKTVTPESTTTYTLIGYYSGGSISDSVTVTVNLPAVPLPLSSSYVTLTETSGSGTGGYYHVGDSFDICYSYAPASYSFEFRDYYDAIVGSSGEDEPYTVLDSGFMFDSEDSACWSIILLKSGVYHRFEFRVTNPSAEQVDPPLIDSAEIWIYVLP